MNDELYFALFVTAIVGCLLWTVTGGCIHAYVISPAWKSMGETTLQNLAGLRPVLALICTGLVFGLAIQIASFIGAFYMSEPIVIFLSLIAGAGVGALQGIVVSSEVWGFAPTTVFHSDITRLVSGSIIGFILTPPSLMIGARLRQRGDCRSTLIPLHKQPGYRRVPLSPSLNETLARDDDLALATRLHKAGRIRAAFKHIDRALEADPDNANALY